MGPLYLPAGAFVLNDIKFESAGQETGRLSHCNLDPRRCAEVLEWAHEPALNVDH